jgi:hypothetical protein
MSVPANPMRSNKPTTHLILSGKLYRRPIDFWLGFINIQRALKTNDHIKIFVHTWDKEKFDLISSVYGDVYFSGESFKESDKMINSINKARYKMNLEDGYKLPSFFYTYQSRNYALALLENQKISNLDRIVITRFDIGYRLVTPEVSTIIIDDSLPRDYIYMSYYNEIDEGYGDQWFVFGADYLSFFKKLEESIFDTLLNDEYYYDFTNNWPNSKRQNKYSRKLFYFKKIVINKLVELLRAFNIKNKSLLRKKQGLILKLDDLKDVIRGTAEIESFSGTFTSKYQLDNALNSHAILKYLINNNGLRNRVRFLKFNDFEPVELGIVINPSKFSVLIYSHSSYSDCWQMTITQFKENLTQMDYDLYIATEDSEYSRNQLLKYDGKITPIFYDDKHSYTQRIKAVFDELSMSYEISYFVHEDMPLYGKVDTIYFNSLIKYFSLSDEFYIKLVDTNYVNDKIHHKDFPILVRNKGLYSLSIQPSLIKIKEFLLLINNLNLSIYDFEKHMTSYSNYFSAVKGDRLVGKYAIVNNLFPHISTALFKGKWTINEWGEELEELLVKYSIDKNLRGIAS